MPIHTLARYLGASERTVLKHIRALGHQGPLTQDVVRAVVARVRAEQWTRAKQRRGKRA